MANEVTMLAPLRGNLFAYGNGVFKRLSTTQDRLVLDTGDRTYARPTANMWMNHLLVTSPTFTPKVLDRSGLVVDCTNGPKAELSCLFREHLVCGNITEYKGSKYPSRVMFSGLRHFDQWDDQVENEATHYDFDNYDSAFSLASGITGMKVFGQDLLVYTTRNIYTIRYVGLPTLYLRELFFSEVGCVLPHSLIGNNRMHFFISEDNVFKLQTGEGLVPIGEPIFEYVQETMTTNPELLRRTWAYYDTTNGEVVWQYYGTDDQMTRSVAYNIYNNVWRVDKTENLFSFATGKLDKSFKTIGDLAGRIETQIGTIGEYNDQTQAAGLRLFGGSEGALLKDWSGSDVDTLQHRGSYVLETRDFYFNDLATVKALRGVKLNATYDDETCLGIDVYFSGRNYFDDTVEYQYLGRWKKDTPYKKLAGFKTVTGVIWRLKFVPKVRAFVNSVSGVSFTALSFETDFTETKTSNDSEPS